MQQLQEQIEAMRVGSATPLPKNRGANFKIPYRGRASDISPLNEPTPEPYLNPILLTRLKNYKKLWVGLSEPVENSLIADSAKLKKNGYADITFHLKARLREDSSGNLVLELFPS